MATGCLTLKGTLLWPIQLSQSRQKLIEMSMSAFVSIWVLVLTETNHASVTSS